jgi:hypothetical protein
MAEKLLKLRLKDIARAKALKRIRQLPSRDDVEKTIAKKSELPRYADDYPKSKKKKQ